MLAKEASEQSPCCSRKCVHKLYTQCREARVDAVLDRALTVYSGNQNRSFDRLAQVLRGGYESASDKFDYMFDHGGYLRSFDHRGPIYTQRKQYESRQTGPGEHVRMFLEHFFSDDLGHVEIMPFHDGNSETFKKHLPPWMTKICVYYYYKSWAKDDNAILRDLATESEVKLASFDTFRRTWKEDFPDVTTPKERRDLNNAVFQSRLGHGNFFFFEIDSMDSAKTLLPHRVRIPKTVKPNMLLKYHLTCVKYDGYRPDDIYYYTNTIPHDSSTTCTLIWITIMKTSPPGQKWAASLVVSRVRAAGIEEDEKDMRKRVTRGRPDAKVRKLMAASSTAQPPGVVKTLTDDKKRKRPVKKRRGKKLTVAESEAESEAQAEAEAARSSKRRVPRARKNKNKQ
eukprot:jgi/Tetstr1/465387/TSEL_010073.t1